MYRWRNTLDAGGLPIKVKSAHLLAIKTNLDVEMTDNSKSTKVHVW